MGNIGITGISVPINDSKETKSVSGIWPHDEVISSFLAADSDHDGYISLTELDICFRRLKFPISKRDIDQLKKEEITRISLEEYLKLIRTREQLIYDVYTQLLQFYEDQHKNLYSKAADYSSSKDSVYLRSRLTSLGYKVSDDQIRQYYEAYGKRGLSFQEFVIYLSSLPTNNPRAAYDEYLVKHSAIKYGQTDYTSTVSSPSSSSSSSSKTAVHKSAHPSSASSSSISAAPRSDSALIESLESKYAPGVSTDKSTNEKPLSGVNAAPNPPSTSPSLSQNTSPSSLSTEIDASIHLPSGKQLFISATSIQLLSGGLAGIVSRTCTAPFDRLRTIMQAGGKNAPAGLVAGFRQIHAQNGFISFFQGNGTNCFKIAPETAIKMYSFDFYKSRITTDPAAITFQERFLAGGLAGATSQMIIYPLDVVKTRMVLSTRGMYTGALDCAKQIFLKEGVTAYYKGLSMSCVGIIPYSGLDLMTNSFLREMATAYFELRNQEPGIISFLLCGMISSATAMSATYPLGLLRTRLQASGMPGSVQYKSPGDVVSQIYQAEGLKGFFRGFGPNLLKVVPASTISYGVYGYMMKTLTHSHHSSH